MRRCRGSVNADYGLTLMCGVTCKPLSVSGGRKRGEGVWLRVAETWAMGQGWQGVDDDVVEGGGGEI